MNSIQQAARFARAILAPATLSLALSGMAAAGDLRPGSVLLFPEYDNASNGVTTLVTVTNAHPVQEVRARWTYVDGASCLFFDRTELLTPNDTLTVLVAFHNPDQGSGYLYVNAVDQLFRAIDFDHLIGSSTRIDGFETFDYTVDPIVFQGLTGEGLVTDLDNDGVLDLDGNEYTLVADQLCFPRFLGQSREYQSDLVLLNLSGGTGFTAVVRILLYNDNEELFSADYEFHCWERTPLSSISFAFEQEFLAQTDHNPNEILGAPQIESGWFRLEGIVARSSKESIPDPAILGFLIERSPGGGSGAELPFGVGLQGNGALLEFGSGATGAGSGRLAPAR